MAYVMQGPGWTDCRRIQRARLNLNDPREYAESVARTQADHYKQPYLVHYCGTDEHGEIWRASPLGDRSDRGGYVKGCASYTVQPMSDTYRSFT
jgi:hypothetical protein